MNVAERPILFSGPMVRAILEGRKTQTRRVLKYYAPAVKPCDFDKDEALVEFERIASGPMQGQRYWMPCPYGKPGERLWVREGWQEVHPCQIDDGRFSIEGRAGIPGPPPVDYRVVYRADGPYFQLHHIENFPYRARGLSLDTAGLPECKYTGWITPIHMPRWACRLVLEVTAVRVERLQNISSDDAIAEGIEPSDVGEAREEAALNRADYAELWDAINAKRAPWKSNPWVWMVEFRKGA